MTLDGKTIAILIAPRGTEDVEYVRPKEALTQAGATVVTVSLEPGEAQTVNGDLDPGATHRVDRTFADVSADAFDGLVIPGGTVGADKIRSSEEAVAFVRGFVSAGKPVAAICHGPWALVEADVLKGREVTSYPRSPPTSATQGAAGSTARSLSIRGSSPAASRTISMPSAPR